MKNRKSYVNLVIEIKGNLVDGKDFFNQLEKLNSVMDVDFTESGEIPDYIVFDRTNKNLYYTIEELLTVFVNNKKIYQRLILDQGYFDGGDLTPSDVEELKRDILIAKEMGFNGARKHQKIEDPYFYYYADKLVIDYECSSRPLHDFRVYYN